MIKGVYDACDMWCMYCPVTDRCLVFRCQPDGPPNMRSQPGHGDDTLHSLQIMKRLADAEGRSAPIEVEAFVTKDRAKQLLVFTLDDPLEHLGGSYMNRAEAYLRSRPDFPFDIVRRAGGPTPLEVFAWFHDIVPSRIFRAVLAARAATAGLGDRREEALIAAKVALIGIDRSLDALAAMSVTDDDPRLEALHADARRLRREVANRFPEARNYIRAGLDDGAPR